MNLTLQQVIDHQARLAASRRKLLDPAAPDACEDESDLHNAIASECKRRGWLAFHGSMAVRTARTLGEPDFTILCDKGRLLLVECKTKTGKLSNEQLGVQVWAEMLGHKVHVVRSFEQFMEIIEKL